MSTDKPPSPPSNRSSRGPKDDLDDDDRQLFQSAVSGTRRLSGDRVEPQRQLPPPRARFAADDARNVLEESLSPTAEELESNSGEALSFARPSIGTRTLRKLKRGKFSVQAEIDLHGFTVPESREILHTFISEARDLGLTCVRVIHGKGLGSGERGPVIKRHVAAWLRRWDGVLAFASARPADGGTGAMYVLLDTAA